MWLSGIITVGRKAVSIMNTIKSDSITTLTDNNMSRSKRKPFTESMTMFHLEEDKENVEQGLITIRRKSLSSELFSPMKGPDDNPEPISSEDEEKFESFDWSEFVEKSQKPVRLNLDNEVELAEDCQGMGPGTSSTEREDDINTDHLQKAATTTHPTG